jgi:ABC-type tungstate transport system permease subunit
MPVAAIRRVVLCALVLLIGCRSSVPPLVLATTTSVANSGLLDRVLPAYAAQPVRAVPVGSGRALIMLGDNRADVVISHAPEQEAKALKEHPTWLYRKILYNDFLIVGPSDDPARIAGLTDAVTAMKRILESHQRFLSRGDELERMSGNGSSGQPLALHPIPSRSSWRALAWGRHSGSRALLVPTP